MKITGSNSYIKFDLGNGYVLKADGELLIGGRFVVYKDSMKNWESPHETEQLSESEIQNIINQVEQNTNDNTAHIIFE
jgi:hypothetical protein